MSTALLIPALNPDDRLLSLVQELRTLRPYMQILIVDDGSDPPAGKIFDQLKFAYDCILCRHPDNYGKGAALKTGIRYLLRLCPGCTGFVTADADGQHRAVDVVKVAIALEQHPHSLILGARDFSGKQTPFKSRWGNRITSAIYRWITGAACPDTQTGLRGVPAAYGEFALNVPGERFEYEMFFLLQAAREGVPLRTEPIETVYLEHNSASHFRPVRDSASIYGMIAKYAVASLLHRPKKRPNPLLHSRIPQDPAESKATV